MIDPPNTDQENPFRVELFGGPRLYRGAEEVPLSRHQRWLLTGLYGGKEEVLPRATIVSWFWPSEDTSRSRRRLNQLLYAFQRKLQDPGVFLTTPDDVARNDQTVISDLVRFREALGSLDFSRGQSLLGRRLAPLIVDDAPKAFHDWLVVQEVELNRQFRKAAESSWHRFAEAEEWEQAVGPALALLQIAPDEERRLRAAMEALVKAGRPSEAESVFLEFREQNTGSDWDPPEELLALSSAASLPPSLESQSYPGSLAPQVPPPLQGRNQERNLLRRTLTAPPRTEIRAVLVSGEAGIGKTRLIQEAIQGIPLDGQRVLAAESAELEQLIPLNPLIEVFRAEWVGDGLRGLEEPWRTVLFGVMPGHYPGDGPVPEAPEIQPGSVPRRLFEAFYRLLLALADGGPLILVLEDLQWADETTLSVLDFLIRRWNTGRLQLLISVRGDEARKSQVLSTFLENLRIHLDFVEINLADLDPSDSEALIKNVTEQPLAPEDVAGLRSLAGGNPFFLIELTFEFLAGRLAVPRAPEDLVQVPVSIRQLFDRRFSQLSSEAEHVLGALAVFCRPLELEALKEITRLSGQECLAGIDQLHRYRLIQAVGNGLSISHELVRHTVYQNLSVTRKAWLHSQISKYLTSMGGPIPLEDLAVHYHHAGITEKARAFAKEAADRAETSGAVPEALRFLGIARDHASDPEEVAELIHRMGHLHYLHQNLEEAAPLLELAAQRFQRLGNAEKALGAEAERIDCLAQRGLVPLGDCFEELNRIQDAAESAGRWELFAKALDIEAKRADQAGRVEILRVVLAKAASCKDRNGPTTRCKARAVLALNVYYGDPLEGLASAREAVEISLTTDDADLQLHAINRLIVVLLYQGLLNSPEGEEAFRLAEERLSRSGDLNLKFFVRLNRAVWHLEAGELDRSDAAFRLVPPVIRGTKAQEAHTMFHLNLGELRLSQFDFEGAQLEYQAAQRYLQPDSSRTLQTIIDAGLGQCALAQGDLEEAREREMSLNPLPTTWTFDPSVIATFKANMLRRRRDHGGADRFLQSVAADIEGRLVTPWIRLCLLRSRFLTKTNQIRARKLLGEIVEVSERLNLPERKRTAQRLLD